MSSSFTKGPWRVFSGPDLVAIFNSANKEVIHWAGFDSSDFQKQNLANANLIASAPDLLEACKAASEQMEESFDPSEYAPFIAEQIRAVIDKLDAAIARAEGRQT